MALAAVTGASAGIGEAFARKLSSRGYDLLLIARRRERLDALARELPHTEALAADLTDAADLERVAARLAGDPKLEMLVNNAGFGTKGMFWNADYEGQERMHRLHVTAPLRLTHAALPGMLERKRGGVINVSSVASFSQSPGNASYCATKSWMTAFTTALDLELKMAGSPVRVQALCPGFTISEFHDVLGMDRGKIPAALWMKAADVVEASLRGLDLDKPVVVPGWRYKLMTGGLRFIPRGLYRWGAVRYSKQTGRAE